MKEAKKSKIKKPIKNKSNQFKILANVCRAIGDEPITYKRLATLLDNLK